LQSIRQAFGDDNLRSASPTIGRAFLPLLAQETTRIMLPPGGFVEQRPALAEGEVFRRKRVLAQLERLKDVLKGIRVAGRDGQGDGLGVMGEPFQVFPQEEETLQLPVERRKRIRPQFIQRLGLPVSMIDMIALHEIKQISRLLPSRDSI